MEFCKHVNFEDKDRKGNRTGTQGPSGITFVNTTNAYLVNSSEITNNSSKIIGNRAICDLGDFVIDGGYTSPAFSEGSPFEFFDRAYFIPSW